MRNQRPNIRPTHLILRNQKIQPIRIPLLRHLTAVNGNHIEPRHKIENLMSGDVVSSPAKNEGCIGAPKSERVAQYPIQGPAKMATRFRHIQRRQGRIAYAIPEMRRESAGGVIILHRQPTQSSLDGPSGTQRMPGEGSGDMATRPTANHAAPAAATTRVPTVASFDGVSATSASARAG